MGNQKREDAYGWASGCCALSLWSRVGRFTDGNFILVVGGLGTVAFAATGPTKMACGLDCCQYSALLSARTNNRLVSEESRENKNQY